jgi:hypothetical protein
MRKAFRHTGVLMMLGVVALGLVGAAYTLWFEDLQLGVTANTGTFNADMSIHPWNGSGFGNTTSTEGSQTGSGRPVVAVFTAPRVQTRNAGNVPYADYKDFPVVGGQQKPPTTCNSSLGHFGTLAVNTNDTVDSNKLDLVMSGLYPYAGCEYQIDIHNSGSVPFHISLLPTSVYQKCDGNGNNCQNLTTSWPALSFIADPASDNRCAALFGAGSSTNPDSLGQLQVAGVPVQIHTGDELLCKIKVVMDQAADGENVQYKVQWNWRAYQWNELPSLPGNTNNGGFPAPPFRDGVNEPFFPD